MTENEKQKEKKKEEEYAGRREISGNIENCKRQEDRYSSRTDCFVADFRIYDPQRPYHTPSARGVDQGAWRRYDCRVRNDDKRCGSFFEKYFE